MFKLCPTCRAEFQLWVEACPDCAVSLVHADAAPPPPPPAAELPAASELVCVERGDPRALREIAERFQAAGISCRIDGNAKASKAAAAGFGLYVLPADAAEAARVRTQIVRDSLPELDVREFGLAPGSELAACPACGEPLTDAASACGGCGLEFPEASEA